MLPIIATLVIPLLLSGPLHGAVFRSPYARSAETAEQKRIVPGSFLDDRRGRRRAAAAAQDKLIPANNDEIDNDEAIALHRSGSCSKAPQGKLPLEKRTDLADLPLNELLIQLQKPPFVSPPNPHGPTIVDIGLYVYEIVEIDPGENTFVMEGFIDLVWCDPRERFDDDETDNENSTSTTTSTHANSHVFLEKDAEKELEYIWWPTLFFVNEVMPRRIENEEVIIYADGTIEYREKFGVKLSSNYDMRKFPFDTQVLVAEVESFAWSSEVLQFHIEEDIVGFSDEFEIPEYTITGIEEHLEERMEPRDRHPFSELVAEIYVARDPVYYVTKVVVPLGLIVCISWAVFWMDGDDLADRMAISFTGVLTSVAYQFIVAESLPRHIYNTFLDNFVLFSFVMMALTIVENIIVSTLLKSEKKLAKRRFSLMESRIRLMESSRSMVVPIDSRRNSESGRSIDLQEATRDNADNPTESEQRPSLVSGARKREEETASKPRLLWRKVVNCINPPGTGEFRALHLDKICRYVFPSMYVVGVSILAGAQMSH